MPDVHPEAWERIVKARVRLILRCPYLASAVIRLPLIDATGREFCPTFATDGFGIYVNLDFAASLSDAEVQFVLAHELLHCVLGHFDRRGGRHPVVWNQATDFAINLMLHDLGFQVPCGVLLDEDFRDLSAERIYDTLAIPAVIPAPAQSQDDEVESKGKRSGAASRGAPELRGQFDAHLTESGMGASDLRPNPYPSEFERRNLRRSLCKDAAAALRARGLHPGAFQSELALATVPPLAWQGLLSHFMTGLRRSDYRLFPPHRKHIHRGVYLPSLGVPGPEHLIVAVDTSGSMSDDQLSEVMVQIDHLRAATECSATLLEFDVQVIRQTTVDSWEPLPTVQLLGGVVSGRGGTDLCAPFTYLANSGRVEPTNFDALIVVTDGFGPVPAKPPPFPVLWIMTSDGVNSATFGAEVRLPAAGLRSG